MKRIISLLLVAVMMALAFPFTANAAPDGQAINFNGNQIYMYFNKVSLVANNCSIAFDLSMEAVGGDDPVLVLGYILTISPTTVNIGGTVRSANWGTAEINRFRRVEINYSSGNATVSYDGEVVAQAAGSFNAQGLYFLGSPGHLYLDNLVVTSAGLQVLNLNFDDEGEYLNQKSQDSTAIRGTIPADSYYTYNEVEVPPDIEYIFDTPQNAAKLTVQSGVEMDRGDCNGDGDITSRDARVLKQVIAGLDNVDYNETLTDVNADGDITARDSRMLKQIIVGLTAPIKVIVNGGSGSADFDFAMEAAVLTVGEATLEGADAALAMDPIDPESYPYAVVTYMTPASEEIFNSAAANKSAFGAWGNLKQYDLTTDGHFHAQIIDLSDVSTWNGDAATLRYFVAANEGDKLYVDSIIFCATMNNAVNAKSARETATSNRSIAPQPVVSNEKIGYYDDDGNYRIVFDTAEKVNAKVTAGRNTVTSFEDNAVKARATGSADPGFVLDLEAEGISATQFKYIAYVYKNPNSNVSSKKANIYYVVSGIDSFTGGYESDQFGGQRSSNYTSAIVDLSAKANWTGSIKKLRIDYFTDTTVNDVSYIDSIIFCTSSSLAGKAGNDRVRIRSGIDPNLVTAGEIWNTYRNYYKIANTNEFIAGEGTNIKMYFRFGSYDAFTARSLGDRFARAVSNATGYQVTAEVYSYNFVDLRDKWGNEYPENNMFFTLRYNDTTYLVWVDTIIMKDGSYSDPLDGNSNDPYYDYPNNSNWAQPGYYISEANDSTSFQTMVAVHSNHEAKIVKTPYGTFACHHLTGGNGNENYTGGGTAGIFRIYDDGSYRLIYSYDCTCHTTKPHIMYGDDGYVYFVQADDGEGDGGNISLGYFDPSQPNGDGSYNVTYNRSYHAYVGGQCPGGYGYSATVLDPTTGYITSFYCGGREQAGFYLAWFTYSYRTHRWVTSGSTVFWDYFRHAYLYAYPDGNGGIYLVSERSCLLECVGLKGIIIGPDYAWDEITMFHINDLFNGTSHSQIVIPADYTQMDREMYPGAHNSSSDVYITQDNKMHVIWTMEMHGRNHHDTIYHALWHAVYDIASPGAEPTLITREPIQFISSSNYYSLRFVENSSGQLYILAVPNDRDARCEVWKATNELATEYELVACRTFIGGEVVTTGLLATNNRNHSVYDNTIVCMYPTSSNRYKVFTVTLPAE